MNLYNLAIKMQDNPIKPHKLAFKQNKYIIINNANYIGKSNNNSKPIIRCIKQKISKIYSDKSINNQ